MRGRMGAWERGGTEFCASAEPANRLPSLRCDCPARGDHVVKNLVAIRYCELTEDMLSWRATDRGPEASGRPRGMTFAGLRPRTAVERWETAVRILPSAVSFEASTTGKPDSQT